MHSSLNDLYLKPKCLINRIFLMNSFTINPKLMSTWLVKQFDIIRNNKKLSIITYNFKGSGVFCHNFLHYVILN